MNGRSAFTASSNGILVYGTGDRSNEGLLTWFDRAGKVVGAVPDSAARYQNVRIRLTKGGRGDRPVTAAGWKKTRGGPVPVAGSYLRRSGPPANCSPAECG
jgi:hypothetical protein